MFNKRQKWLSLGLFNATVMLVISSTLWAGISREEKRELKETHKAYKEMALDELSEAMSLAEALRYGVSRNAALRSAYYRWKAAVHDIKQSTSWEDPQVAFKLGIDHVETRLGPQEQAYSISQHLPFPGKLYLQGNAMTAVSRQFYADYQKAKLDFFYELRDAYYEYWFLYKNILVTEKNMELLKHFEGVAQSRFKSGLTSNQDLLKAQVELGKLENDLLTLNDYRKPVAARLNAVLDRDVEMTIAWPAEIDHEIKALDEEIIYQKFHENNPDLEKAAQRIEESKKKVWLARMDYLPDLTVSLDYIATGSSPMPVAGSGRDATSVMFKVNLPLWYGKQKSQLDEASAVKESAEADRRQAEKELAAKIKMIYFKIRDAERQIKLYRDALVPKAEQSLKASETAYSGGKVDFLNLIDSQRMLLGFQLSYYKSIRDYQQRLAELEMMIGESLGG